VKPWQIFLRFFFLLTFQPGLQKDCEKTKHAVKVMRKLSWNVPKATKEGNPRVFFMKIHWVSFGEV
jgi:hypothetical protein